MYKTTTFRLEADSLAALELIARVEGRSLSELLREAANKYLDDAADPHELLERMRSDMEVLTRLNDRRSPAERSQMEDAEHPQTSELADV